MMKKSKYQQYFPCFIDCILALQSLLAIQSFAAISRKCNIFNIIMAITPGATMISRKITPFFSSVLYAPSVGIFHFCITRS